MHDNRIFREFLHRNRRIWLIWSKIRRLLTQRHMEIRAAAYPYSPACGSRPPQDVVECTAAFGYWLQQEGANPRVVLGRDGRISGELVSALVTQTLVSLGFEVIDLDYSTTPTVEIAVPKEQAGAGIVKDSDPQSEYREVFAKSAILKKALKMAGEGL